MWKIIVVVIVLTSHIRAQKVQDRAPSARHIKGIVVDAKGKPVADAFIGYADERRSHQTASDGRFEVDTRANVLVVRKAGFRSARMQTQDTTQRRIILHRADEGGLSATCSSNRSYEGIDGWPAMFQFPRVSGIEAGQQVQDVDFGRRNYYLQTKQGKKGITHGSGPSWSLGQPSYRQVIRSVKYQEITYEYENVVITDARGQSLNGNRWRYLGRIGESAFYSDIDKNTAKILDRVLDGACLQPSPHR